MDTLSWHCPLGLVDVQPQSHPLVGCTPARSQQELKELIDSVVVMVSPWAMLSTEKKGCAKSPSRKRMSIELCQQGIAPIHFLLLVL